MTAPRPTDEIRFDLGQMRRHESAPLLNAPGAVFRLAQDVPSLLDRLAAVERERDEARRVGRLDGQEANNLLVWAEGAEERVSAAVARAVAAERERDEALAGNENLRQAITTHDEVRAKLMREQAARHLADWLHASKKIAELRARVAAADLGALAAEQSEMIDGSYPADLPAEAHLWRRVAKAGEEHGEVIEAVLGCIGENPRKGITGGRDEVIKELLDEAFAALGAVEHLRGNDGSSAALLVARAQFVTGRLRAALAAPSPQAEPAKRPVPDLMEALRASVDAARQEREAQAEPAHVYCPSGLGCGRCSCGAIGPWMESASARKRWHSEHKAIVGPQSTEETP